MPINQHHVRVDISSTRLHNRSRFDNVESWFPNFSCSIAKEEMEGKNSEFIFKFKREYKLLR